MPKIIKTRLNRDKKAKKKYSKRALYLLSALKGFILTLVCLMIISYLLYKNGVFTPFNKLMVYLGIGLGAFLAGYSAHTRINGRAFSDGLISASIYTLMLLFIFSILLKLSFSAHLLIIIPVALLSGFLGGIVKA